MKPSDRGKSSGGSTTEPLLEDFTWEGDWWLPGTPEKRVAGTLEFRHRDRIRLDLKGSLCGTKGMDGGMESSIVLGVAAECGPVTLLECFPIGHFECSSGIVREELVADYILAGKHCPEPSALRFNRATVSFSDLGEWLCWRPIRWPPQEGSGRTVLYEPPEELSFRIRGLDFAVILSSRFRGQVGVRRSCITHEDIIRLESSAARSLDWLRETVFDLQNLLILITGQPIQVTELGLDEMQVYYMQVMPDRQERARAWEMLLTFPTVRERFEGVINAWFESIEVLRPICHLLLSTYAERGRYLESEFLSLVQALESYHRGRFVGKYSPDAEYEDHRRALAAAIPSGICKDHRQSLENRLKYGNEFSLRKRLTGLCSTIGEKASRLLMRDPKAFVKKVVDTRNQLIHSTEDPDAPALKGGEFITANWQLKAMLTVLLLKEMTIEGQTIVNALEKNREWAHWLGRARL